MDLQEEGGDLIGSHHTNEIGRDISFDKKIQNRYSSLVEHNDALVKEFKVYSSRWVMLSIFCLAAVVNQVAWISLQPVA